jgi:hypothetical protein
MTWAVPNAVRLVGMVRATFDFELKVDQRCPKLACPVRAEGPSTDGVRRGGGVLPRTLPDVLPSLEADDRRVTLGKGGHLGRCLAGIPY